MCSELTAKTEPGKRLVALAEALADEIAGPASKHDREASFPFESLAAVKRSATSPRRSPRSLAASASPRSTTWSSRRAGSPAATRR
jgi:hypothetical protein